MEKKPSFFLRVPVLWCAALLLFAAASMFRAYRMVWVFYGPTLRFLGGALGLLLIALALLMLTLVLLALRLFAKKSCGRLCAALGGVCVCFAALFAVGVGVITALAGRETNSAMLLYLKRDLPVLAIFAAAVFLLLVLPALRGKGRVLIGACFAVLFAAAGLWQLLGLGSFHIVSDPLVLDTGSDYAVVFATNKIGTGCISYTYEGEAHTIYAQTDGRRVADRLIHAVRVPYAHLKNNSYTVGATRVTEEFSYGSRLGASVEAGPFTLRVNEGETQRWLVISDWHTYLKDAKAAISNLGAYDSVIMLGDPAPGLDFEAQAVENIVRFGGDLTGGEKPVLYVRGNHETRGAFADDLASCLGLDRFYYTASVGPYTFLALDSGEDKPDDHIEYGALDDYAAHRLEELDWLKQLSVSNDKLIVLTHAWQFSEPEEDVSRAAWDAFSALGARFVLSGHTHTCRFLDGKTPQEQTELDAYPGITTYIDGGHAGKTYIASLLTLTPQAVRFEAANNRGEQVLDETLPW